MIPFKVSKGQTSKKAIQVKSQNHSQSQPEPGRRQRGSACPSPKNETISDVIKNSKEGPQPDDEMINDKKWNNDVDLGFEKLLVSLQLLCALLFHAELRTQMKKMQIWRKK